MPRLMYDEIDDMELLSVVTVREMEHEVFSMHVKLRHPLLGTQSRAAHEWEHRRFGSELSHTHELEETE